VEERKVVTVLFADLVGFTARAEQLDPEDVRALLRPYHERARSELERFGGTVEKFIGDAVMAVFGAPVAHEDDPERAVRAALALRDAIAELNESEPSPELEVRVAVHTGEALVSLDADPARGDSFVAGDVVNTASRLQSFAPVNGVLVGETTHRATQHAIAFRDADPVRARGKSEPIRVWEAVEPIARIGTDPRREGGAPLLGRARQLDQLRDALGRALDEPSMQLVTLVGVPGIGKSRLVRELLASIEADSELLVRWRQGRSLSYGEGVTFWALGEIVKAEAGILETDASDVSELKLDRAVSRVIAEPSEAAWALRLMRPLVGLTADDARAEQQGEAFAAWRRFLEGLAEDRPTVLVLEDLHWADDALLDFVDELAEHAIDLPLLVVATARPELLEQRPNWAGGKRNALTISLAPLSRDDTARLLTELLETPVLAADLQTRILERAEGNPLFAEEYARLVEQGGSLDDLPESLGGLIAARLDALDPEEKAAAQAAAILGETFWTGGVQAVVAGGGDSVLRGLERKEFVRRRRTSTVEGETEYAFQHSLVRDVAYAQIPRAERAERHLRAAAWVESLGRSEDHAEMLAHHYLEALALTRATGNRSSELEERARGALVDAAGRAVSLGALPAARRYYEAALELTETEDDARPLLLLRYARTRADDDQLDPDLLESAHAGLLRQGEAGNAAEAKTLLALHWWMRGDRDRAFEHLARAAVLVENEPESSSKASVLTQVARFEMLAGEFVRARRAARQAVDMAERLGLPALVAPNLNTFGVSRVESGDAAGLDDLERAVEIARGANNPVEEFQAASNLTWMIVVLGDVRRAWKLHLRDCELAERFGLTAHIRWERGERLFYLYWLGEWPDLVSGARTFLDDVSETGHYLESQVLGAQARVARAGGDIDGSIALAQTALERGRRAGDPQITHAPIALLARLLADRGDRERAAQLLDELFAESRRAEVVKVQAPVDAAHAAVAVGRANELLSVYEHLHGASRWIEAAVAIAAGDYVAAAELLGEIGSLPDEADARFRAAETLVRAGQRTRADEQLARAVGFWRSVGASAYVNAAESLRARAG
jgi:class 3 adenylate cyclase/tetratricopeptide (TPR) repeat protein